MKFRALIALTLTASLVACASEEEPSKAQQPADDSSQTGDNDGDGNQQNDGEEPQDNGGGTTDGGEAFEPDLERGAPLNEGTREVALADLVADPAAFADAPFITEGTISQCCTKQGCWFELRAPGNRSGGRIVSRFKDYGFFVPLDSRGNDARVEAVVKKVGANSYELESSGVQIRFAK